MLSCVKRSHSVCFYEDITLLVVLVVLYGYAKLCHAFLLRLFLRKHHPTSGFSGVVWICCVMRSHSVCF